jgi:hypothetical protein
MSVVAAAVVGSAVVGAYSANQSSKAQSKASQRASDAQVQANRETIEFQREVFDQQREDNAPWREIGTEALGQLQRGIASGKFDPSNFRFEEDPGYQFRLSEGVNALDKSAAARGMLQSGAQQKALTRFGQDFASNEYANAYARNAGQKVTNFNQLASLSNVGQVANQADANARTNMANQVTQSTLATGNAIAQNYMNQGNIRSSEINAYNNIAQQGITNWLSFKGV